jgi:hypothetical protein
VNSKLKVINAKWLTGTRRVCLAFHFAFFILNSASAASTNPPPVQVERAPESPREFFNTGTRLLREGKLGEAEMQLHTAVSRQEEALLPAALYNLGHVRFAQGAEELKKAPNARQAAQRTRDATAQGEAAIHAAESALASQDVQRLVEAYRRGQGSRKELNATIKAVRQALETYAGVLARWQRAAGDFKSAAELNPADASARRNADIVERHIARLIDEIRALQQALAGALQCKQQLGEAMAKMRGQLPGPLAPPGAAGDEDEEEDELPGGLQPGMQEGPSRSGEEMRLSPEEAGRMLNGFRLDGERRLPMGQDGEGKPKDPNRPTW